MASGFFLSNGARSGGSGYPSSITLFGHLISFQWMNQWVENTFGKQLGDGWGVRNWFGPSQEGDWSRTGGSMDYWHILLGIILWLIVMLVLLKLWFSDETKIALSLVIYSFLATLSVVVWTIQQIDKKLPGEYLSAGEVSEFKLYIRPVIITVFLWSIISLIFGAIIPQSMTSVSLDILTLFFISVIVIPFTEASFFGGIFLAVAARFLGIIPSIVLISFVTGGFHQFVFSTSQFNLIMSIVFGFMTYPLALKYKSKEPLIDSHILANFIAFICKLI